MPVSPLCLLVAPRPYSKPPTATFLKPFTVTFPILPTAPSLIPLRRTSLNRLQAPQSAHYLSAPSAARLFRNAPRHHRRGGPLPSARGIARRRSSRCDFLSASQSSLSAASVSQTVGAKHQISDVAPSPHHCGGAPTPLNNPLKERTLRSPTASTPDGPPRYPSPDARRQDTTPHPTRKPYASDE